MHRQFRQLRLSQLDRSLSKERKLPPRPSGGWIASVREALGLTLAEVGKHLRAPRQTVQKFEHAEGTDRITLGSLRRIADAVGCDLAYAIVPKSGSFAALAERVFLPPDFPRYRAVSRQVREILQRHTDLIEPLSLDEAYLDVSENKTGLATATLLGFARS